MLKPLRKLIANPGSDIFSLGIVDSSGGGADDDDGDSEGYNRDFAAMNEGVRPGADDENNSDAKLPAAPVKSKAERDSAAKAAADKEEDEDEDSAPVEDDSSADDDSDEEPTTDEDEEDSDADEDADEDSGDEDEDLDEDEEETETPKTQQLTEEQRAAQQRAYEEWEKAESARLEKLYQLTDEDAEAVNENPEKVLPKIAARLHLEVQKSVAMQQQAQLPQLLNAITNQQRVESEARNLFYGVNPDLKDLGIESQITRVGSVYRQMNPNASPKKAAREIGNIIRGSLGTKKPAKKTEGKPPKPPVRKPHKPVRGAGSRPPAAKKEPAKGDSWADLAGERGT